jgi:drug/metabolite transporter (DMT)-like permease
VQIGATLVATRFVVDQLGPVTLALFRYAIGFACLAPPALLLARPRFALRDLLPIALIGIGQFGILIVLLNFGLRTVPSGRASLIFATFPLLTMLVAAALRYEALTARKTVGVLLTIAGVAVALAEKLLAPAQGNWLGEIAIFFSAFIGATCSVVYRPYLQRYPTLAVSAYAMFASVVFLLAFATTEHFFTAFPRLTVVSWYAVAFIGLSSGVAYFVWLWALAHASPTRVTAFLSLSPITAVILGEIVLAEPISGFAVAGLLCVVAGLWIVSGDDRGGSRSPAM